MRFSMMDFFLWSQIARRKGVQKPEANKIGLMSSMMNIGKNPMGIITPLKMIETEEVKLELDKVRKQESDWIKKYKDRYKGEKEQFGNEGADKLKIAALIERLSELETEAKASAEEAKIASQAAIEAAEEIMKAAGAITAAAGATTTGTTTAAATGTKK
jgi:transposase-like protein